MQDTTAATQESTELLITTQKTLKGTLSTNSSTSMITLVIVITVLVSITLVVIFLFKLYKKYTRARVVPMAIDLTSYGFSTP